MESALWLASLGFPHWHSTRELNQPGLIRVYWHYLTLERLYDRRASTYRFQRTDSAEQILSLNAITELRFSGLLQQPEKRAARQFCRTAAENEVNGERCNENALGKGRKKFNMLRFVFSCECTQWMMRSNCLESTSLCRSSHVERSSRRAQDICQALPAWYCLGIIEKHRERFSQEKSSKKSNKTKN